MSKKILVTGANGFIGSWCIRLLLKKGYDVIACIHHNSDRIDQLGVRFIRADISCKDSIDLITKQADNCDVIIHLAADIRVPGDDQSILSNTIGTYNVGILAQKLDCKTVIYLSSLPVIGMPYEIPITEKHPVLPLTVYHETKFAGEVILSQLCSDKIVLSLRAASPIGLGMNPNNYLSFLMNRAEANEKIIIYGKGKRVQNYIDVRDLCDAFLLGINASQSGIYVLPGYSSISNIDLANKVVKIMKSQSTIEYADRLDIHEDERWIPDGTKIKKDLGYIPKHSVDETIRWIMDGKTYR